jgi:quercetin dioxygenase-like cupin family protein
MPMKTTVDAELEQDVFAAVAAALKPVPLPAERAQSLRARVLGRAVPPPAGTATWRVADEGWISPAPGVQMKFILKDEVAGRAELLVRLGPGARVPAHVHSKEEQMVILEGECRLGAHLLRAGDTHIAPPGTWHPEITVDDGVVMLLRAEYPLPAD